MLVPPTSIDSELKKVFQSKAWRQVFRAQLAAQIVPSLRVYPGAMSPQYRAREAVAVADAILAEVGMIPDPTAK